MSTTTDTGTSDTLAGWHALRRAARLDADAKSTPEAPTTPEAVRQAVTEWAGRVRALKDASNPAGLDAYFSARRAELEAKHRIEGLLVAPAEVFEQLEAKDRADFDEHLRAEARDVAGEVARLEAALDAIATASHELRPPMPKAMEARAVVRTAELLEREEVRRQFAGRPLNELRAAYERATDDDAAFVAFVEAEVLGGFRTLHVRASERQDTDALRRLTEAVRARREARVPAIVREARAHLAATWTPVTRSLAQTLQTAKLAAEAFERRRHSGGGQ